MGTRFVAVLVAFVAAAGAFAEPAAAGKEKEKGGSQQTESDKASKPVYVVRDPLGAAGRVRAPKPGRRSLKERVADPSGGVGAAMSGALDLRTSPDGFQPIDWSKPVTGLKFDRQEGAFQTGDFAVKGNVSFSIDDSHVQADSLSLNRATGEFGLSGNVLVLQGKSRISADSILFRRSSEEAASSRPTIAPLRDDQGLVQQTGSFEAENFHLEEPRRSLQADHIFYDYELDQGEFRNVKGRMGEIYFGAQTLRVLGPATYTGEDVWVTTCDKDPPHYRLRMKKADIERGQFVFGRDVRMQLGGLNTPLYWPRWSPGGGGDSSRFVSIDFDLGRRAELGYFINVGQHYRLTDNSEIIFRLWPTQNLGIGGGIDIEYDLMESPASPLYRSQGSFRSLYTTDGEGNVEFLHRQELGPRTLLMIQSEQWSDRNFYKRFYFDEFRDRTEPRTFVNVTHTRPESIASFTMRKRTHDFTVETERLPEGTFHLLEREVADNLYISFDSVNGYNDRAPLGAQGLRTVNIARLSYSGNIREKVYITPFFEGELTAYSDDAHGEGSDFRFAASAGVTAQTRLTRTYRGRGDFKKVKHIILPSATFTYRPRSGMRIEDTPFFDALDVRPGRMRLETKIDNIFMGYSAKTNEMWQVARFSFYQGNDFWNEGTESQDYEVEIDLRPWPRWGFLTVAEHHDAQGGVDLKLPVTIQQFLIDAFEYITGQPFDKELNRRFNIFSGDFNRLLSYVYYTEGDTRWGLNGRIGFAYTEADNEILNKDIIYGLGFKTGKKWSLAFEHQFNLDRDTFTRQTYEIRRTLHKWEMALQLRDRESGFDISVEFFIAAFPGSRIRF